MKEATGVCWQRASPRRVRRQGCAIRFLKDGAKMKTTCPFLKKLFFEKYGPPTSRRSDGGITSFVWRGKEVEIELDPGDQYQGPGASFTTIASDKKLSAENAEERAKKDAARKAARKNAKD